MAEMAKVKLADGTKVFIGDKEVGAQSISTNIKPGCILTAKVELPIDSISHDSNGNLVIRLLER